MDIVQVNFCPICGYATTDIDFSIGDICDCCGCEMCFSDDITEDDLEIEFDAYIIKKYLRDIEKDFRHAKDLEKYVKVSRKLAWKLLRTRWVRNGCIWKWNDENQKPTNWNLEKAEEQLRNIGADIKEYL